MKLYNIVPVESFGKTYDRIEISPVTVDPFVSASWKSRIFTVDGDPAAALTMDHSITGPEYDAWGEDDQYIIDRTVSARKVVIAPQQ